jgi:hypothetical protein
METLSYYHTFVSSSLMVYISAQISDDWSNNHHEHELQIINFRRTIYATAIDKTNTMLQIWLVFRHDQNDNARNKSGPFGCKRITTPIFVSVLK